jgi:hypothetical protein
MFRRTLPLLGILLAWPTLLAAQETRPTPSATWPPTIVRKLPPPGTELSADDRRHAETLRDDLRRMIDAQFGAAGNDARAEVEIFAKALDYALRHNEFYDAKSNRRIVDVLAAAATARLDALKEGKHPWTEQRGTVVRGYRSALDDSYQPYGLVIPAKLDLGKPVPLYVWLHGRGDTACDLQFLYRLATSTKPFGPLLPDDAIVLHPFGRYCNGYKSAGEVDVFEAIADVAKKYKIDADRIVLAGFSMGGAGAWHLGAHYADRWCAVHAGAGFVDVRRYQNITPDKLPPSYEQKLWGLYDVPDYRRNLLNVPVLAYSGEVDKQKQAADIMEAELAAEGLKIPHLIGPKMGHKYDPAVLVDIHKRLVELVAKGRDAYPKRVALQTKTLRYHKMFWVEALGLERHWDDSRIDAEKLDDKTLAVTTKNVAAFKLVEPWGAGSRFGSAAKITVDGQAVELPAGAESSELYLAKRTQGWIATRTSPHDFTAGKFRRKLPGLQGPIDDAFVEPFQVVVSEKQDAPTAVERWADFEAGHFLDRWRTLMRGEARTRGHFDGNVVLWGTPQTNPQIRVLLDRLPLTWTDEIVALGDLKFDAKKVVPMLIYPHPENPTKYVVINSGLTFRESQDRTNSLQNPKLGDWAFIDVTEPPNDETPGRVLAAGFFDEQWQYVPQK